MGVGGALGGLTAGVAAISTLGVPGLGAADISSGLAAIGSAVTGGGMAAGAACVIAAPAATAAIFGYLIYRLTLWLTSHQPPAAGAANPIPAAAG